MRMDREDGIVNDEPIEPAEVIPGGGRKPKLVKKNILRLEGHFRNLAVKSHLENKNNTVELRLI